ncbi:MAG: DUF421 domain-containing protein [Bacteroidota bacterium]|nr:DUF421 domain-containing protein [Bacteroidota bacterium]
MKIICNPYINIIVCTIIVYLFIIIAIRLFGKKELSQLSVIDLVFILLISNAVQNAMVVGDNSLAGGVIAASTLFLVNFILKRILYSSPRFRKIVEGEPITLVYKGRLMSANLKKSGISRDELMEAIREHGVSVGMEKIDLAMLETDGNISILSDDFKKRTSRKRKVHKVISKEF